MHEAAVESAGEAEEVAAEVAAEEAEADEEQEPDEETQADAPAGDDIPAEDATDLLNADEPSAAAPDADGFRTHGEWRRFESRESMLKTHRFLTLTPTSYAAGRPRQGTPRPSAEDRRSPTSGYFTGAERLRTVSDVLSVQTQLVRGSCRVEHMFDTAALTSVDLLADEAELIGRIAELERLKSAAAAGQARAAAALDERRRAGEAAQGVPAAKRGRGLASEVALARRDSPSRGNRHLGFAKALVHEMPHTLAALECGALSEWRATLIVRESACLSVADRRALEPKCARMSAVSTGRATLG